MSEPVLPSLEDAMASNAALQAEVAELKAKLEAAPAPSRASVIALGTKKGLKKLAASVAAAFTTPTAIKAEKSLAVVALTRAALLIPSAAVLIDLLVKALGGPGVTP
jgi:hypothetical protein